mgnify:CR=1 FL=1
MATDNGRATKSRSETGVEASDMACESLNPNIPCRCRDAVVRAYKEMVANGASNTDAHLVAARVYSYHHPGYPVEKVHRLIARLVEPGNLH